MSLLGQKIIVKIEKLAVGGAGLARHEGLVVFVHGSAPQDELEVEIIDLKKNHSTGKILRTIKPSPLRAKPVCSHYGSCGGCNWQHLSRENQLSEKQQLVESAFRKLKLPSLPKIETILPSPHEFGYRNRVQMIFDGQKLCFHGYRSHDLVPIDHCHLAEDPINERIKSASTLKLKKDSRYEIFIDPLHPEKAVIEEISEVEAGTRFSQVNRFQNESLIESVLEQFPAHPDGRIFELYAGAGNFTFPLLKKTNCKKLVAVEGSPRLVQQGQFMQGEMKISPKKLSFVSSDVEQFLKTDWPTENDSVFLDPPRTGSSEYVMKTLAHSRPRQIVYMSCQPVTLCRDLAWLLKEEPRYSIEKIQPFEMFPQTDHIECLVSLKLTQI